MSEAIELGLAPPKEGDLEPTAALDSDHPEVMALAARLSEDGSASTAATASRLFAHVRDRVRYDPFVLSSNPDDYRASAILRAEAGYCVQKAVALAALARAAGIPARLGFADVRNHLQTPRLRELMGTELFVGHGYSVLWIDEAWVKASPAFNRELCERHGVSPLDFDGREDALLHAFDGAGRPYMSYERERGTYSDLPLEWLLGIYRCTYPSLAR